MSICSSIPLPLRRPERKVATRQRLVDRTRYLCERQGFLRLRTADVARAARLSHGAVFVHFPTREALLREVAGDLGRAITDRLYEQVEGGAALPTVLQAHLAALAERETLYRHLLIEGPLLSDDFRLVWIGVQSAVAHHIGDAARAAMAAGTIRPMTLSLLIATWVGLVHHYCVNRDLLVAADPVLAARGGELVEHFMALVTPTEGVR
ncbi:MAG: TetR/AcrR family transcriptional regulator [Alphaproteobacteria bacterium]|nr:TetR/AcrR family transcriptional regulator [Alphaproteobacteria bacterium]